MNPTPAQQALLTALHAEYAAVYAYGLVAAYSRADRRDMIAADVAAHRARRDELIETLTRAGVPVPPADAGYTVPFAVEDPIPAAELAVAVESDTATAWLAAVERADTDRTRGSCIDALVECAVRLAGWRSVLGIAPPTTAFPGKD